ncbi:MAG: M23 family metallopeptidase [Eubacteriales bacterium]
MKSHKIIRAAIVFLCLAIIFSTAVGAQEDGNGEKKKYIRWIDFSVSTAAMDDALKADIASAGTTHRVGWIDLLALLASKNGGNFDNYRASDLKKILSELEDGKSVTDLVKNEKLYNYYREAYNGVLGGLVGKYTLVKRSPDGSETTEEKYGLRAFSPIAAGYYYNHYDDFGASRSYGYRRSHLGHDLMGSVGTPIIAVESGYVECCGWNRYGGWRIGIRSFDGLRYYYYAHLRRGHPYCDIYEGKTVNAGEVIGYLGMTGYSSKEDTNNINVPHLHYGLEVIFDPSQKDGTNQIWIDMYALTDFLSSHRSKTYRDEKLNEAVAYEYYVYEETPD